MSWLRMTLALALLALMSGLIDAQSEQELGRFRERLRASHAKFGDVFVRALRAETPDLDEAVAFLDHNAFALRARAVELLDVIDHEREHNLFAGQLDALIAEEARLEASEPALLERLLDDPIQAIDAAELHQTQRAGTQRLRRELAKLAWRHGDRASRAALRLLLQARPSDTFTARALADVGGAPGIGAIVATLELTIARRRDRAKALSRVAKTIAALKKQEKAAKKRGEQSPQGHPPVWPPSGPRHRGPQRPANSPSIDTLLIREWFQHFELLAQERGDEQAKLTALMQEAAATFKSPRVPKPNSSRGTWARWWKKAEKSWPKERTPGPVVFRSKDAFDSKVAAIHERQRAAVKVDEYIAGLDELDASLGSRRSTADVALRLFATLEDKRLHSAPKRLQPRKRLPPGDPIPLAARVHVVRLLTLRPNQEALGALLPEWLGPTAYASVRFEWSPPPGTPTQTRGVRTLPVPATPALTSEWAAKRYAGYKQTFAALILAQPQEQRHRTFRALAESASSAYVHDLTTWMLDNLLAEPSDARDWHVAVELVEVYDRALAGRTGENPVYRLVLEDTRAKFVKRLRAWAKQQELLGAPPGDTAFPAWKEWIERVAPIDAR